MGEETVYLTLYCHPQNDFCIETGSAENHFNDLLIVRDKVTRQCPQTDHDFGRERKAEVESNQGPSAYQSNALLLGQDGSSIVELMSLASLY